MDIGIFLFPFFYCSLCYVFRSLICVCDTAVCQLISILKDCSENRSNIMFRISHHCKEVEGFAAVLRFLILAYQQVVAGVQMFAKNSLFPPLEGEYEKYTSFLRGIESLDTSCFYARPLGFQVCYYQHIIIIINIIFYSFHHQLLEYFVLLDLYLQLIHYHGIKKKDP